MLAVRTSLMALLLLAACDGNPFVTPTDPGDGGGSTDSVATLPGTTKPSAKSDITRHEATNTPEPGNGFAEGFTYDKTNDTFTVDNLAFDGGNVYQRSAAMPTLGPANVYQSSSTYADSQTGANIDQFSYRALYGVSTTGNTSFAIVRTGSYQNYGFGGFIYGRKGGVTIPTTGQAHFAGSYAGLRDFSDQPGMQMTTGDMTMDIDFADFNDTSGVGITGNGVKGVVTNRKIFDLNGNDITQSVIASINTNLTPDTNLTQLPALILNVGPGASDKNGEIEGTLGNEIVSGGTTTKYEDGKYYAVLSGSGAGGPNEVTGVIVVTSAVQGGSGDVRETGGFILYRP